MHCENGEKYKLEYAFVIKQTGNNDVFDIL